MSQALSRIALAVNRAHEHISLCGLVLFRGNTQEAQEHRLEAQEATQEALALLCDAGTMLPDAPTRRETPSHLLSTPASRRLLRALREAQEVAEAVDAERGDALLSDIPLLPDESHGTGWAESISSLTERLRLEVEGPKIGSNS